MLVDNPGNESHRDRILDVAERLFMAKGLAAVTLRDIGAELGLTHASLYYYFPKGKESLFIEVTERNIRRHGAGLDAAILRAGEALRARLRAAARWLLSQPPMDLLRMVHADLAAIPAEEARRIMNLVHELLIQHLHALFDAARAAGEIGDCDTGLMAGGLIGMVESLHAIPEFALRRSREELAFELVDTLLKGLDYHEGGKA
jgi:AcrR family transcriptional regulator